MQKKTAKLPARTAKKKKPPVKKQDQKFSLKRLIMGEEKPDLTELEAGSTTVLDILSPTTIDTKSRDYIVVDGIFHAYLYVAGYGYSTTVGSCWLAPLVEAGEGVNLSFIFKRQPKEKILSKIAQTTMVNRSRMRDVGYIRQDFEELDSAISSGLYLKDAMNRQGEDFYYMHTLVEVTAEDAETLEQRVTAVEKLCEKHSPGVGGYGSRPMFPRMETAGFVEQFGYGWLHIQLNTLLPHCRYQTSDWISDTIRRLLDEYVSNGSELPFFKEAMLVIDEHCGVKSRHIFDQDNKGWKAVSNAIKGRLIPDDDQHTLALTLLSTKSELDVCHITLLDMVDVADFFAYRSGDYAVPDFYGGSWGC